MTNIRENDNIEVDKLDTYSSEMLSSVSDLPYSTSAVSTASYSLRSISYSVCDDCDSGSNDNFTNDDGNIISGGSFTGGNCNSNVNNDYTCDDYNSNYSGGYTGNGCDWNGNDGNTGNNAFLSAIPLGLSEYREISYSQLEQGVWYKFTANDIDAHPDYGRGFYHIYTYGDSQTIGELYDSSGKCIASNEGGSSYPSTGFEIYAELEYAKTYYVYVKEKNLMGYGVFITVQPVTDDHGNSISTATYLGDVYSQNFSVSGFIHNAIDYYQKGDLDYFSFTSSRDCVVEVFSEGSSEVYGAIYDETGHSVELDSFEIENDDFKLTFHMESNKKYYIEISKLSDYEYATSYTFNVKFIKLYNNGQYCGGDNFEDITKHNMELTDNGYLVCTNCGYKIQSPTLQDKEILSEEDYYKVLSCYLAIPYYATLERAEESLYIPTEGLLEHIDNIRSKSEYAYKYDYVDAEGKYICTHHADVDYNYKMDSKYHNINNQLDLILMGASANETIELTDRIVYITHFNFGNSYQMKSKFVFSKDGTLKAQYHSYS